MVKFNKIYQLNFDKGTIRIWQKDMFVNHEYNFHCFYNLDSLNYHINCYTFDLNGKCRNWYLDANEVSNEQCSYINFLKRHS